MASSDDQIIVEVNRNQLQHFTGTDPRCRGVEMPEGIMLRYTQAQALYFYLRTAVKDGKILTRVFASDSPYERQKTDIGEVATPMFDPRADHMHLEKVKHLLHAWVNFVERTQDTDQDFQTFAMPPRRPGD